MRATLAASFNLSISVKTSSVKTQPWSESDGYDTIYEFGAGMGVGMLVGDIIQPITRREILKIVYDLGTKYSCGSEAHPADPPWQDIPQIR